MAEFSGETHIICIIDKSGSMAVVRDETITGFNSYLHDRQAEDRGKGKTKLTLTLFDTTCLTPIVSEPVALVTDLDSARYVPGGFTALNDAVMESLRAAEAQVGEGDRALVCIVTDGQENSSREATTRQVQDRVAALEARGNWTFSYLSASPKAFADAAAYGIPAGNTATYNASHPDAAFRDLSVHTCSFVRGASASSKSFYQPAPQPSQSNQSGARGVLRTPVPAKKPPVATPWTKAGSNS